MQRGFQFLPRLEVVALQNVLNPAVKSLDHAIGLRRHRRRQAVVYIQNRAKFVELMFAGLGAFAQAKPAVGELFSVVGQDGLDAYWAGPFQIAQKAARIGRCLTIVNADEDPAGGPINRDKQVSRRAKTPSLGNLLPRVQSPETMLCAHRNTWAARFGGIGVATTVEAASRQRCTA